MAIITMKRDEMTSGTAGILRCAASLESISKEVEGMFSSALDAGFLSGSVSSITGKTSSISGSLGAVSNTINNKTSELYEIDQKGEEMFNAMEMSKGFYANNDAKTKMYTSVLLEKMDAKSVNEGELKDSRTEEDESSIKTAILKDIRGNEGQIYDEQHSDVQNVALGNINNGNNIGPGARTDSSVINQALGNINNGVNVTQRTSDNAEVVNADMKNVNGETQDKDEKFKINDIKLEPEIVEIGNDDLNSGPIPPLATSAYNGNIGEAKGGSVMGGIAAGLAGLAGLAGVAGMAMASRENEKEEDEEEEDKKEEN